MVLGALLATTGALAAAGDSARDPRPSGPRSPDDPAFTSGLAWHLAVIGAPTAWWSSLGEGVTVAVVDSGIDVDHPDLAGQVAESVTCLGADGDPGACRAEAGVGDPDGHGTHVAGLIAGRADDGIGVVGVAPRARLLAIRTLRRDCDGASCLPVGDTADVAAGVRWAVANGADVINLSLTAGRRLGPDLTAAVAEAWEAGAVPVLAAGNDAGSFLESPPGVVVTATTRAGSLASYAPDIDVVPFGVAAPGGSDGDTGATCRVGGTPAGIVSTYARESGDGSGYGCLAGTSMAAPQVSGGLALLLSMGFTRDQAVERLLATAHPGPGLGSGLIDLRAATAAPLPVGARATTTAFANRAPAPSVAAASVGPFASPAPPRNPVPQWLMALIGGLSAGLAADLALRIRGRRRAESALAAPSGPRPAIGRLGPTADEVEAETGHRPWSWTRSSLPPPPPRPPAP